MESVLEVLEPLTRLICTAIVIVLFFLFIVQPLLKYFIVNREIEHHKKLNERMVPADSELDESAGDDGVGQEIMAEDTVGFEKRSSERETLNRLATSDPDKAGELVKKWVNSD